MSPLAGFTATGANAPGLVDGRVALRLINSREKGATMKPVRVVGVCLLAAVAFGAVNVATASAEAPEFGQCLKKAEPSLPGYTDGKCTKEATEAKNGKYEWLPGAVAGKNRFTISGGGMTWETTGGKTITCASTKGQGEYSLTNNKQMTGVVLELATCGFDGFRCTTTGSETGELVFNEMIGEAGYEDLSKKKTALKLTPKTGGKFIEFSCVKLEIKVRGKGEAAGAGILVNIKNDTMTAMETLKYKVAKGVQKPVEWEGTPAETYLENAYEGFYEQAGWTDTWAVTNNEEMKYELNLLV